ncbi:hypothetical protein EXIGLDRAFT_761554 [Exidia glandulosa HHB12029]|uniref:Uncharacterized protein n=1 Tax=Exidia glandulosa HHB12029 TaxID=1314781 RepID=A0A166BF00_EXIGL|nr:hypothetical protein EXIGLDRAFT_691373 [Exidia glandulosa HHB12029]KZW00460.1 hypothetical protein EXIGLDRAFT_761554 [Exidia glandulosa HHB12029]
MVAFKLTAALGLLSALPFTSAIFNKVTGPPGTFFAGDGTVFPVTFTTGSVKVTFIDLTVTFALGTADQEGQTVGIPLKSVDLVAEGLSNFPGPSFTIPVPLSKSDIDTVGDGPYVLSVIEGFADGIFPKLVYDTGIFRIPFNVTFN